MANLSRRLYLALITCVWGAPIPAAANCDAVIELAILYDGFFAVSQTKGDQQRRIASRLYPNIAATNFASFANTLDAESVQDDIRRALTNARDLTRNLLTSTDPLSFNASDMLEEVQVIGDFLTASDCPMLLAGTSGGTGTGFTRIGEPRGTDGSAPHRRPKATTSSSTLIVIVASIVLGAGTLASLILRSRPAKIYRMKRLPRKSIQLAIPASYVTDDSIPVARQVIALDISLGGMKLRTPDTLTDGTKIDLALKTGPISASVVWSTAHYVGILFDERLSETELDIILSGT